MFDFLEYLKTTLSSTSTLIFAILYFGS